MSTKRPNIILGIDPGIERTGFGIIESAGKNIKLIDQGCITTSSKDTAAQRLLDIEEDLQELLAQHKPNTLAIEKLFFAKNVTSALAVGQARGVILLTCAKAGLSIFEYNPMQVKVAVTGYGGADKEQMEKMVQKLMNLDFVPAPDDVNDALALAICHAHNQSFIEAAAKK
ncbi:crossover junction endodeoxyribonuclease RuvC [Patescibacteria group bacterium]